MNPPDIVNATVTFSNVTVVLDRNLILDRVTAVIPRGGCTAVVGPNGAGKTTLLLAMLGYVPHRGEIGFPGRRGAPRFGYVPQRLDFDRELPLTAGEFIRLGESRSPLWLRAGKGERARIERTLSLVNLEYCRDRRIGDLSGGELQRLLLAAALERKPEVLLLDEAVSATDPVNRNELIRLLERFRREMGFAQVMISHDLATVLALADHLICLDRKVLAAGTPEALDASGDLAAFFPGISLAEPKARSESA
ncbi:MAG: metal ABC transporter ATP-binding protein [Planctomycetota bacterium]|jgi:zinc transport system ATP-binding protein|nr:metal ABC transporter ATP-binding protein [Planctomycetota bacterium]